MRGFYFLRWVLLALLLAGLVYVIVTADCWEREETGDDRPELVVSLHLRDQGDVGAIQISGMIWPGLANDPDLPHLVGSAVKTVNGEEYRGVQSYCGQGANGFRRDALVIEAFARRFRTPVEMIDIHVFSKSVWALEIENFAGGIVRHADSKQEIAAPYWLEPGEYHLEAVMPEEPDGE